MTIVDRGANGMGIFQGGKHEGVARKQIPRATDPQCQPRQASTK